MYKLNSDVAIDSANDTVGVGIAIRDYKGCVMATSHYRIITNYNPKVAKTVAIFKGIQLACDTGLVPFEVESDVAVVVGFVNDMRCHDSGVGLGN
ncbi:hypothetical protein Dsin_004776 [Dipteronia sinensis]|uniref:RNase H type-1 domain-containing protein n=1 Tax=Dipteronia sinensis TaxID=43782 RepID=A0AAE0AWP8_9ROSI|nr:hypothetical protein Dsin_004776 [Dipteronia sinensis]